MEVRLRLRPSGRNHCGRYTLARVPTCPDPDWTAPNYRLEFTTACSPASGPGSWRWRRYEPPNLSSAVDALLSSVVPGVTGADDGAYSVALTGGSGYGAVAAVTVVGGVVTGLTLTATGRYYVTGETLQIPALALGAASTAVDIVLNAADFVRRRLPCP